MHRVSLTFVLLLCSAIGVYAQVRIPVVQEKVSVAKSYPLIGSHLLGKEEALVNEYVDAHPEVLAKLQMRKITAWNFSVGDAHVWYSVDFINSTRYPVQSTCRSVGTNCYIFVEDSLWGTRVTQASVDSVRNAFDLRTPASATKGVYQMDVEAFGDPPDVDGDPRIIILILNIRDGFNGTGGYVAGYFSNYNEMTDPLNFPNSDQAEIYFLDANPQDLSTASGLQDGLSTTAHEFQHMIHWYHDQSEIRFIDEGCALLAEVNAGYPMYDQSGYVSEPNHYLFDWRLNNNVAVLRDYSRAARFMTYLRDQVGIGAFKPIVASTLYGIAGIDAGLASYGSPLRFNDLFGTWLVANALNDRSVDPTYGYVYSPIQKVDGRVFMNPSVPQTTDTVQNLAAQYLSFKNGSNLQVNFTTSDAALAIKAVEIGSTSKRVLSVTPGTPFTEPGFGSTYSEVDFIIENINQSTPFTYTYQASGAVSAVELKWDETEPSGYLALGDGDTVCVQFDGVSGGRLDSVRVALRRAGSITGGIWTFTGNVQPTPIGSPLAAPITATISTTTPVPYPVPFQNWATVDLHATPIDISNPFVVGFVSRGDPSVQPRVMITKHPGASPFHSFTYYKEASTPNWYFFADQNGDSVYIYLIRAYVSFPTTGVRQVVELMPLSYFLSQNYPNPFNPSTTIKYQLPISSAEFVSLKVFDVLGREVATLVNGMQQPGEHMVQWDASNQQSGVYYYRLQVGTFSRARKLVFLK